MLTSSQIETETAEEYEMSKGNKQRGNREYKKPKKEKPKVVATSAFQNASTSPPVSAKKPK